MFKDLYKKANDKIPTEDAYLRVMEKVNAKPKTIKYSYGKIAALAACFILTISLVSVYEKAAPKREEQFSPVTQENIPAPNTNPTTEPQETEPTPEAPKPATPEEIPEPIVVPQPVIEVPTYVKNHGIPENIGVGVAKFTLGESVTEEAYFEYLGKNVIEGICLPVGFCNQSSKEHILTLTPGEEFNDRWTFYFASDDATIFMTTTKSTEGVSGFVANEEYQKSRINETDAVVFEDEAQRVACFVSGDIGYTVSSYGVSDEDFEKLLTSLIK